MDPPDEHYHKMGQICQNCNSAMGKMLNTHTYCANENMEISFFLIKLGHIGIFSSNKRHHDCLN